MGMGYEYKCPDCGYNETFDLGVGFGFPEEYHKLLIKVKNGELGEELHKLIKVYPQGEIDTDKVLAVCNECGNIEVVTDLSFYVPKKERRKKNNYVMNNDLFINYEPIFSFPHKCKKCHGNMKIVFREGQKEINLKCPECCAALKLSEIFCWD